MMNTNSGGGGSSGNPGSSNNMPGGPQNNGGGILMGTAAASQQVDETDINTYCQDYINAMRYRDQHQISRRLGQISEVMRKQNDPSSYTQDVNPERLKEYLKEYFQLSQASFMKGGRADTLSSRLDKVKE